MSLIMTGYVEDADKTFFKVGHVYGFIKPEKFDVGIYKLDFGSDNFCWLTEIFSSSKYPESVFIYLARYPKPVNDMSADIVSYRISRSCMFLHSQTGRVVTFAPYVHHNPKTYLKLVNI